MSHTQVSSESMDILEIGLQNRLDEYRDSHPNLVKLWKEYIKVKRISYLKSIVDCLHLFMIRLSNLCTRVCVIDYLA